MARSAIFACTIDCVVKRGTQFAVGRTVSGARPRCDET
jgi:hypothetical protein